MSESDCPLCMETLEIDDLHFYPCTCGYQICRFCWHRIRTDGNGLCPACRKTYTEDPAMYRALTHDEIQKVKKERKQKEAQHKQKISDNRQHLSNIRVIQRHLVFVVGLSNKMADIEVLKRPEYFGSYGKIMKIVINPNTNYAGPQGPSASAYITYTREDDALKAILAINEMQPPLKIRASLGTTKYCTHYLRNLACPKVDCMYLHDVGDPSASFTKEDMTAGKHQLFEKNLLDDYISRMAQLESQGLYDEYDSSDHHHSHHLHNYHHQHHHMDTNTREDWGESENADINDCINDSTPPTKSSWCTKPEDVNITRNEPSPTEYPVLEARKPSPRLLVEHSPSRQPNSGPQSPRSDNGRPKSAPINTPKPTVTSCKPISTIDHVIKLRNEDNDKSQTSTVTTSLTNTHNTSQSNLQTSVHNDIEDSLDDLTPPNDTQHSIEISQIIQTSQNDLKTSHSIVSSENDKMNGSLNSLLDRERNSQSNLHNSSQNDVRISLQNSIQTSLNNNLQHNLQPNIQNKLQNHAQDSHQKSLQSNLQSSSHNNLQNNFPNSIQNLLRNNNYNNMQSSLQNILPEGVLNAGLSTGWTTKSFDTPSVDSPLLSGLSNNLQNNATSSTLPTTNHTLHHTNYPWPSTSDLGLCDLKINPSDEDLGFDPFSESKSGLEDLMASEKNGRRALSTAPQSSFNWDSLWPNRYGSGRNQMALNSYSLFGASHTQPVSNPQIPQYRPSLHAQYPSSGGISTPHQIAGPPHGTGSTFPRFSAPHQPRFPSMQQQQMPHNDHILKQQQHALLQQQQSFLNLYRSQAPAPPPHGSAVSQPQPSQQPQQQTQASQVPPPPGGISADKNWQDGLRALLPNIKISFSNQQAENKKLSEKWSSVDTPQHTIPTPLAEVEKAPIASPPPPPGFKGFTPTIGASEAPKSWIQNADTASAIPGQLPVAPRPAPPPGFGKPTDTFPPAHPTPSALLTAPTTGLQITPTPSPLHSGTMPPAPGLHSAAVPPAPGIHTVAVPPAPGLQITTIPGSFAVDNSASTVLNTSQVSEAHDDPSILWSKVLKDVPKDLGNTELTFPLPGEGLKMGSTLDGPPPGLSGTPPNSNHLTSWNTIVSGSQPLTKGPVNKGVEPEPASAPSKQQPQHTPAQPHQPLQASETIDIPLQKPPIFCNQQKQQIKQKPTATVKPLKPLDGFTTVQSNRPANSQQPPATPSTSSTCQVGSNASTGSRVSELDDFSADLPSAPNLNNNVMNINQEFPLASATTPPKMAGAKKKKKKGKDQVEQVAEVTVGRVEAERPPVALLEDERPKKSGKTKKKTATAAATAVPAAVIKASPPPQHKSPPTAIQLNRTKEQHPQQPEPQTQVQTQPIRILKSEGNGSVTTQLSPSQIHTASCLLRGPTTVSPPPNCLVAAEVAEETKAVNSSGGNNHGSHDHEIVSRLTESTEKLLKNVLFETEAIKLNTEQISKDLKSALEKCKESSLSLSDLEKINLLLTPGKLPLVDLDDPDIVDTYDLERQVESARREAKMLEARLNDVIRKNMASELETLKRNTKNSPP